MNAVRIHATGGPDVLTYEQVEVPVPKDNEALVNIVAAGINYIDTYQRSGLYAVPIPSTLGREAAGVVAAVGKDVTTVKVGDRVAFLSGASYAEQTCVPEAKLLQVPDGTKLTEAAAVMLQGLTAHYLCTDSYTAKEGDSVVVHAGAGGTGGLLIQMAKLRGAKVFATASTEAKRQMCLELGADYALDYEGFADKVLELNKGGVQGVYDGVGAATYEGGLKCLNRRGTLVTFGNASGKVPPIDPLTLTKSGSLFLTRPTLADHVSTREELVGRTNEVFNWIKEGKLKVRVAQEFPLEQAQQAHELLQSRKATGKILLRVNKDLN